MYLRLKDFLIIISFLENSRIFGGKDLVMQIP